MFYRNVITLRDLCAVSMVIKDEGANKFTATSCWFYVMYDIKGNIKEHLLDINCRVARCYDNFVTKLLPRYDREWCRY